MRKLIFISIFFLTNKALCQSNVFSTNLTVDYAVEYIDSNVIVYDTIAIFVTGRQWQTDANQKEIIISYAIDQIDTSVFRGLFSIGWINADTTGAVDNEKFCWFHPPRHNQYSILELAPFPRVEYPLRIGKKYARLLSIGEGWGEMSNSKITWSYNVVEHVGNNWKITSIAIPDKEPEKINRLDFVFNEIDGFLELNYLFDNGIKINMKRIIRTANSK